MEWSLEVDLAAQAAGGGLKWVWDWAWTKGWPNALPF